MSVSVESLELQVQHKSTSASQAIESLANSLTKLKTITKGGAGLTSTVNQLNKLSASLRNVTGLDKISKIAESLKPDPVVVTPAPVVVPQPVVVQQPVVVAQPVTQVQNVWVEGRYVHRRDAHDRMIRVWEPGHYEQRMVTITP